MGLCDEDILTAARGDFSFSGKMREYVGRLGGRWASAFAVTALRVLLFRGALSPCVANIIDYPEEPQKKRRYGEGFVERKNRIL